jgi:L-lactate dehydrogenase
LWYRIISEKIFKVCDIGLFVLALQGQHGIDKEVFLSLPCVLSENGVTHIVKQPLTEEEKKKLQKSAALMHEVQTKLRL